MANGAKVRAGVVGTGHMGQYHVLVYAELPDVELVGVADADPTRAAAVAEQYDTRVFADHRALVGRVDVASVAVPTDQHFAVARDLLEGGVSVLVEKPMAPTLEQARELFEVAERTGAVLHVGHVERFNGAVDERSRPAAPPRKRSARWRSRCPTRTSTWTTPTRTSASIAAPTNAIR